MRENELYGHGLTIREISERCNYTKECVSRKLLKNPKYTVTFDVKLAYAYKQRGYKVLVWGGLYEGVLVFVFAKKRVDLRSMPFWYCQESCANLISYKPPGVLIPGRTGAVKIAAHLS